MKQTLTRGVSDGTHQISEGVHNLLERIPVKQLESVSHQALDTAHHALDRAQTIGGTAGRTLQDASHAVKEAVLAAVQQAAARAGEVDAPGKARTAVESLTEVASHSAHVAGDKARHALEIATETAALLRQNALAASQQAKIAAEEAREAAEIAGARAAAMARHAATEAATAATEAAVAAKAGTATVKASATAGAATAVGLAHNLTESLEDTVTSWRERRRHDDDDEDEQVAPEPAPQEYAISRLHLTGDHDIQVKETSSRWMWILLGVAVGAFLALLFAPSSGRRSRAAIQDRMSRVKRNSQAALSDASSKAVDLTNRAQGIAHNLEQKLHADPETEVATGATLADKVRTALGRVTEIKDLARINVEAVEGVVTLRGPLVTEEVRLVIEDCVRAVPGVTEVKTEFLPDEPPQDPGLAVG